MATSTVPALLSAFAFGIIVNSASAGLLLHINGHGASIVRDGQRLVLATFLLGATVWALTAFIATAINTKATSSCHIGIVFSTLFDQLARFSIEQYLLWAINRSGKQARAWQLIPQVLLLARFVLGAVFVGFSRPSFAPVCVPTSSTLPLAVVVVAVDAVLIAALVLRAVMAGVVADARNGQATSARSKSILLVIVAFAIWTATSVTMLLGIKGTALLLRTLLPAIGLLILLTVVTIRNESLTASVDRPSPTPDSPGVPSARNITTGRSVSTEGSSEDASDYPPRRFEDLKRADLASATMSEQPRSVARPAVPPPPSNYASATAGAGGNVAALALPRQSSKAKRNFFDRKGSGSTKVSKISNPILQGNGDQNPLSKIPTISLEEAVRSERERREIAQQEELHRESALIAKRPAPPPPNLSPEEVARRSVSLKRKQVATYNSPESQPPPMPSSNAMDSLSSTVSTSSAQLSPGVDELRRRSPRQTSADRTLPRPPPPVPSPTLPLPAPLRPAIRPSRQLPESLISPPSREQPKSALQRRPTNGLPGNPRARAIEILAKEADAGRQQTVLFMNDIVYNSPETVQGIIDDATVKGQERFSTQSIVHRPRPIPRQNEKDRAIFPAERSPGHRRNKSSNSNSGIRKSILQQSTPGSPTHLPPLPPPPPVDPLLYNMERPNADRPHPNDTKSMTFDEKMTLFFPTPPYVGNAGGTRPERRSSVPDIPQMPLDYMPLILSPLDGFDETTTRASLSTTRTGRTSVKTESILEAADMRRRNMRVDRLDPMDRVQETDHHFSAADDVGNSWLPGIAFDSLMLSGASPAPVTGGRKRASSPIIPPNRASTASASSYSPIHDDTTTNWGSVHSPVVAMPASRQVARTMYINVERNADPVQKSNAATTPTVVNNSKDKNDESDDASAYPLLPSTTYKEVETQWHRRVGDDCPTFSDRKEPAPSRKLPPPSPLRLQPASTKNPIVVKAAEPSPLESPERALAYIQAQLKRYEEPEMTGADTPGRGMALLENLEKEMDAQAGHWKDMQQNLRHDSLSSIQTMSTVPGGSRRQSAHSVRLSRMQGKNAMLTAGRLAPASFHTPLRNSMTDLGSPTPPDSDDSDVEHELSHPRNIAEALSASLFGSQEEAAAKDKKTLWTPPAKTTQKNTTALLWSADAVPAQAGLPATIVVSVQLPSYASAHSTRGQILSAPLAIESSALWTKKTQVARKDTGSHGLWMAPLKQGYTTAFPTHEALSGDGQPQQQQPPIQAQGQTQWRLQELEREMTAMEEDRPRASVSAQVQKAPRPVTQRPPRRSRRITVLPDIVENPEPLPDKRGTLGIFRFPWGERSDTVVLPPTRVIGGALMAMPGTMASGGGQILAAHEARARQLEEAEEAEAAEATASFFEDYDDSERYEDEEDGDSEAFGSDSDDGFDENTLWEIASLLKTEQVPSTLSMFPPPFSVSAHSVVDDYMSDLPSDDDESTNRGVVVDYDGGEDITVDEIVIGYDVSGVDSQRVPQEKSSNGMWAVPGRSEATRGAMSTPMLFSKEAVNEEAAARAVTRTTDAEPLSRNMPRTQRTPDRAPLPKLTSSHLWTGPASVRSPAAQLWVAVPKPKPVQTETRLFDPAVAAMERLHAPIRTTDLEPAALNMPRKLRARNWAPLPKLTSSQLWAMPASVRGPSVHLWVAAPKPKVVRTENSLFDPAVAAIERLQAPVRTTDLEPAGLNIPRKPRTANFAPLPKLTSTHLWTAPASSRGPSVHLWVAAPKPKAVQAANGLFDPAVAAMERLQAPIRTTDLEPAALHMPRKAWALSWAPLPKLTSTHLWMAPVSGRGRGPQLWQPRPKAAAVLSKSHLFDRDAAALEKMNAPIRTTDEEPVALHMPRKVRTLSWAPLPKLTSTHLWKAPVHARAQLWVAAPKPAVVLAKSLLFDPVVAATEKRQAPVRTTDLDPAALNMPRKLQTIDHAPLPKLTSTRLWQQIPSRGRLPSAGLWTVSTEDHGRAAQLWAPTAKPTVVRGKGHLFDREAAAMEKSMAPVRKTSLEPAASHIPRKYRTPSQAPLPQLESSHLWSKAVRAHAGVAQLWTPVVPVRPVRMTRAARGRAGLFDKEVATQAKQRVPTRTTAAEPIAAQTTVRGRRTGTRLPSLTLTSSTLWDKNSSSSSSSSSSGARPREWLRKQSKVEETSEWPAMDGREGVQQPAWWEQRRAEQRQEDKGLQQSRRQRPVVSAAAWDAALQEALVRSYRRSIDAWDAALQKALVRSYPPSAEAWDAALQEALARSYPPQSPSSPSTASTVSSPATPQSATQRLGMTGKPYEDAMEQTVVVRD